MLNKSDELLRENWLLYLDIGTSYRVYYKKTLIGKIKITEDNILWENVVVLLRTDEFTPRTLLATYIACPKDIEFAKSGEKYYYVGLDNNANFFKVMEAEDIGKDIDIQRKAIGNFFPANMYTSEDIKKKLKSVLSDSMPNIVKSIKTNGGKNNV